MIEKIKEMPPLARADFLRDNADEVMENQFYRLPLSEEQQRDAEEKHMRLSIDSAKLNEEFSRMKNDFKKKLKAVNDEIAHELQKVRLGAEECKGTLYYFKDHDENMMFTLNEEGEIVGKRHLTPKERQSTLMSITRNTGTGGGSQ